MQYRSMLTAARETRQRSPSITMYFSIALCTILVSYFHKLTSAQFSGQIQPIGQTETDGLILVTIANNSTGNYSIEARNNLFDDANPYRPLQVKDMGGKGIILVGTQAVYGQLDDSAFVNIAPGSIWQRTLNMTEYLPPDATAIKAYSQCFSFSFPSGSLFAVNTTDFVQAENLATGFLKGDSVDIFVEAPPLHMNVTVQPGARAAAAAVTATVGSQLPATVVQGTATAGLGGAQASYGSSIENYLGGASGIFAKSYGN